MRPEPGHSPGRFVFPSELALLPLVPLPLVVRKKFDPRSRHLGTAGADSDRFNQVRDVHDLDHVDGQEEIDVLGIGSDAGEVGELSEDACGVPAASPFPSMYPKNS